MRIEDYKIPKTVDPRVRQMLQEIVDVLNDGGYENKVHTSTPSSSSPGFEGENRFVVTGATMREYKHANGSWWYTDVLTEL